MGASVCKDEIKTEKEVTSMTNSDCKSYKKKQSLKKKKRDNNRLIKILLLGSSNSGKSTLAKQIRILHLTSFSVNELLNYRYIIYSNFFVSYHYVACGVYKLKLEIPEIEKDLVEKFYKCYTQFLDNDIPDKIDKINKISSYTCILKALRRLNEFKVPENTLYLFSEAKRILQVQYQPTLNDVIHAKALTTGVHKMCFSYKKFNFRVFDVGGQKTERKKWIKCFENVTGIIFVYSLSCYSEYLEEDPTQNQLVDSVELFKSVYCNDYFRLCSFILFANKKDVFEKKLCNVPLKKFFPSYEGKSDFESALEFIQNLYIKCQSNNDRVFYSHVTDATNTTNIALILKTSWDFILKNNLKKSGSI